ncbi:MAG: ABC-2 family transporter protein [Verrucomicrobium sp.]|nr:ABC-2 family transporter protein [Verrucomicrobium sp.]
MFSRYGQVFSLGIQNTLVYRWNFLLRAAYNLIPLLTTYFIWQAVFAKKQAPIDGYSYPLMIAYYLALVVLTNTVAPTDEEFQIAADIRDGQLNQFLLRPVNYFLYRFILFVSGRLVYIAVTFLPLAFLLYCFRHFFANVPLSETWLPALLAFAGSGLLQFVVAFLVGILGFWVLEISSIAFMLYALEFLAGGNTFPLDLLPEPWRSAALSTPFAYEYFFPAGVLVGRIHGAAVWHGFLGQMAWTLALLLFAAWAWGRGLRRYTAVGS